MKELPIRDYGSWEIVPSLVEIPFHPVPVTHPELIRMETLYEGVVTYLRLWNFWVRAGTPALVPSDSIFFDFENSGPETLDLIAALGVSTAWPHTQEELWSRISRVWDWLGENVRIDTDAYGNLVSAVGRWPSIAELARYYSVHGDLVWSACFSKAHLFATLLGRVLPRWHTAIVSAHHTENGAPPTASHVYVGVYLADRWYYLDPTAVYSGPLPGFDKCRSVGGFTKVDYQHPFSAHPVPLSGLVAVPYLPE